MSVCVRVCEGGWGVCLYLMMHFHEEKDLHLKFERSGNSNKIHSSSCEKAFMRVHRVCRVCPHAGTTCLPAAPSVVLVQFSSLSLFSSSSPVLVLVAAAAEELAMVCGAWCSAQTRCPLFTVLPCVTDGASCQAIRVHLSLCVCLLKQKGLLGMLLILALLALTSSCQGQRWKRVSGELVYVSVGPAGVWGVNRHGDIYYREVSATSRDKIRQENTEMGEYSSPRHKNRNVKTRRWLTATRTNKIIENQIGIASCTQSPLSPNQPIHSFKWPQQLADTVLIVL